MRRFGGALSAIRVRRGALSAVQFRRTYEMLAFGGSLKITFSAVQFRRIVKKSTFGGAVSADQVFYRNKLQKFYIFSFDLA